MAITPAFELFCKNGQKRRRVFSVENCIVHKNDWIRDRLNIFAGWKEERQREFFGEAWCFFQKKQHHDITH